MTIEQELLDKIHLQPVHDLDGNGTQDIYVHFDTGFSPIPDKWRKREIRSGAMALCYRNGRFDIHPYDK